MTDIVMHMNSILQASTVMTKNHRAGSEITITLQHQLKWFAIYFISNVSDCCLHKGNCLKYEITFWIVLKYQAKLKQKGRMVLN